jgi:transposase-like protein
LNNTELKMKSIRRKKKLSAEKKYQIVEEIKAHPDKKAEILRREGLYRSDLARYEATAREGAIKELRKQVPGRKKIQEVPIEEHERVKAELEKKEKALVDLTVEFMVLKKKVDGE